MEKKMFRKSCLLPSSSVYILIPFLPVFFSSDKSWLFFKNEDGAVLCIRKVDQGEYPDVQSKLDEKLKGVRIKLPDELKDSLQRTRILSDEDLVTGNRMVNIVIKDEKMFCHGECNVGQIDETINIDYNGERLSFDIVSDFLFEILGKTKTMTVGDESLRFKTKTLQHIIQLAYETEGKE
jgi:DNA polymerase III sliding clamp (beta) subunit (PCNA family)